MYLENNNIIIEYQSGFRKHHSCEIAIQIVIDDWKLIVSEGEMIGVIFMDLNQVFETVDTERLLKITTLSVWIRGTVLLAEIIFK